MLVGHYAPAFLLKRADPSVPLWGLLLAAQAVDVAFFGLVFAGVEEGSMHPGEAPRLIVEQGIWTHSLLMSLVYGAACALVGAAMGRGKQGVIIGLAVGSHWVMDLLVHVPDLPLWLDQASAVGLGLWRWPMAAYALEIVLVLGAGHVLASSASVRRKRLAAVVGVLVVLQTRSEFVIPLPVDDVALGLSALPLYFGVTGLGWWAERGR